MKVLVDGGERQLETIEKVIDRCRFRIDRSLDVNIADVIRLIEEIEKIRAPKIIQQPAWHGYGTGD